jgi:hypothetical protein
MHNEYVHNEQKLENKRKSQCSYNWEASMNRQTTDICFIWNKKILENLLIS